MSGSGSGRDDFVAVYMFDLNQNRPCHLCEKLKKSYINYLDKIVKQSSQQQRSGRVFLCYRTHTHAHSYMFRFKGVGTAAAMQKRIKISQQQNVQQQS